MAVQFNVATRNARLNAIETVNGNSCAMEIRTGAPPATCATANSGSILVTINLPADWMDDAASGSKAKLGTWQDASADGTGTAGHFRLFNSQATKDETTCFMQGTVGQGSGDLSLDNTSIVTAQVVTISTFSLTDGNA
jgi:hypothetical protein